MSLFRIIKLHHTLVQLLQLSQLIVFFLFKFVQWFTMKRQHALVVMADSLYYAKFRDYCKVVQLSKLVSLVVTCFSPYIIQLLLFRFSAVFNHCSRFFYHVLLFLFWHVSMFQFVFCNICISLLSQFSNTVPSPYF